MRKFAGMRRLEDIKRLAVASETSPVRFYVDSRKFDDGWDSISITIVAERTIRNAVVNMFEGTFIVYDIRSNRKIADQFSENLDIVPWYSALMDLIYRPVDDRVVRAEGAVV